MFDVDAWLDEAATPTRAVKLYGRGDLVAKLQQAQAEHDLDEAAAPVLVDDRLGGPGPSEEPAISAVLRGELEASARTFVVRGLLDGERLSVQAELQTAAGAKSWTDELQVDLEPRLVALAAVEPKLTVAQAVRLRERVGQAQWDLLVAAVLEASREPIDVPLSRLGSGTVQDS